MLKKILILCVTLNIAIYTYAVTPYYSLRSQSTNAAREIAGAEWNNNINLCNCKGWNETFTIIPEYSKTFRPYYISQSLLGPSHCFPPCPECSNACNPCKNSNLRGIKITGSQVETRNSSNCWLADYFGLPTDYIGCVSFEPYIENFLVDLNFYVGLDKWIKNLFFKIHAPVTHTRWNLNCCECKEKSFIGCDDYKKKGVNAHLPGYFSSTILTPTIGIQRDELVFSFESFMAGCDIIKDPNIIFNPLCYARMCCKQLAKTGLSDIQMALGWNFFDNKDYHCGLSIRASAPTGNRPKAYCLFEPIIGNGKHWELGGGLSAHWIFWHGNSCRYGKESLGLYLEANIMHLLATKQFRTFDLYQKPLSRYMLAAKFDKPVNNLQAGPKEGPLIIPSKQFQGIYSPLANITTLPVDVRIDVQADIALLLQYHNENFSYSIGYNFWAKSCEKIKLNDQCPCPLKENTWALKGDAFMYGFTFDETTTLGNAVALSATEMKATRCNGTNNRPNGIDNLSWTENPGIDNRQLAWDNSESPLIIYNSSTSKITPIYTSIKPLFINLCDIDFNAARTKGTSHKMFVHFNYTWYNIGDWVPYIGIGCEIEFGLPYKPCETYNNSYSAYTAESCCSCSASQWGIWIKGGVAFR